MRIKTGSTLLVSCDNVILLNKPDPASEITQIPDILSRGSTSDRDANPFGLAACHHKQEVSHWVNFC